ncbi:hypothetical protein E7744_07215 [Citricoccus sp. SGAir0253]|uniref:hypothetical protein n=1 Tax=Citricoccus sp. SGAir0253 TaxID=2567881 RepID=UPI0010CD0E96|nr:hypothetical protein [Citricoccus sp. SGAir0253]QCU77995.1 hypothetical protein E7744_07215 [Citricoccus sp. SGAir0253]
MTVPTPPTDPDPTRAGQATVLRRESRRDRRSRRREVRRDRQARARAVWVATTMDAGLPDHLQARVPGWAATARGRVLLGAAAVVALLAWALVFLVIAGSLN